MTKKKKTPIGELPKVDVGPETGEPNAIEALVSLGSMSVNENKASVSFASELEPEHARLVLAEGQLSIYLEPEDDELFDASVHGVAECHRLSIGRGMDQKGRLSFQRDAVDIPSLARLSCSSVRMTAKRIGASGAKAEEADA